MDSRLHSMLGETRARLILLLRRSDQTINELAQTLGVSGNAVRTHIAALQRDDLVEEAGLRRDTGGKPARLYTITSRAEELFPKAYALVLGQVISRLQDRQGNDLVTRLLREIGVQLARSRAPSGDESEARIAAAAGILEAIGGDVEIRQTDEGWELRSSGCPLSAVVDDHPEVCALVEALVGEITGRPVAECCERGERPRCGVRIAR